MEHLSCPLGLCVDHSLNGGSLPMKIYENREPLIITTDFFDRLIDLVAVTNVNEHLMKKVKCKISHNKTQKLRNN